MKVEGGSIRLSFDGVSTIGNCLRIHGQHKKLEIKGFEIAGEDRIFHPASAEIDWKTNDVLVSCPEVPAPVAVRYAFHNWPEGANLLTDDGQPVPMFRTDDWR